MKSFKMFFFGVALIGAMTACGGNSHNHEDHEHGGAATETTEAAKPHGEGKEYTSAYVCPMHCEGSGSDEAGTCPKCGMDYVAQADHVKDEHSH